MSNVISSQLSIPKNPWLIQSGCINRPLGKFRGVKLSEAVNLDYMGSSYFESGAMGKSLRRIERQFENFNRLRLLLKVPRVDATALDHLPTELVDGEETRSAVLTVCTYWNKPDDLKRLQANLESMFSGEARLEERCGFSRDEMIRAKRFGFTHRPDFWWDLENDSMWTFDKRFAWNGLKPILQKSFDFMNTQVAE